MAPHEPGRPGGGRLRADQAAALVTLARVSGPQEAVLVAALLELGLRTSEILAADVEDFSRQGSFTVLAVRSKGQADKGRIPLGAALVDTITRAVGDRDSGPLLFSRAGRRMTHQEAGAVIRRLGEQLGIERLGPADLRHAFVVRGQDALGGTGAGKELDAPTSLHPRTGRERAGGAPFEAEPLPASPGEVRPRHR